MSTWDIASRRSSRTGSTSSDRRRLSLRADLKRARDSGQEVAIGAATDPYQPAEARFRITRSVLEAMARVPGLRVGITTKSTGITRDLDLLREIADASELHVNVSADLARRRPAAPHRAAGAAPRPATRGHARALRRRAMPTSPVRHAGAPAHHRRGTRAPRAARCRPRRAAPRRRSARHCSCARR